MTITSTADASKPEPTNSTFQPRANLFASLSTPITATNLFESFSLSTTLQPTNTFTSDDKHRANTAQPPLASHPSITSYGDRTTFNKESTVFQQTTTAQGQLNELDVSANIASTSNITSFALQLFHKLLSPEGRDQVPQRVSPIPAPGMGVAHVYLHDIGPQRPVSLPDLDETVWKEFALRLAPIRARIKKTLSCFMAGGVVYFLLFFIVSIFEPIATTGIILFACVFFVFTHIASKEKKKAFDEEVSSNVGEFAPKFQSKGYNLEYIPVKGMVLVSRIENLA